MKHRIAALFLVVVGVFLPAIAHAEVDVYAFGAGEAYTTPELEGHGIVFVGVNIDELFLDSALQFYLNTDTLTAALSGVELTDVWSAGAAIRGQLRFANLAPDYYQNGQLVEDQGFSASYYGGSAYLEANPYEPLFIKFSVGAYRWLFDSLDTSANYKLPVETWITSPRLTVTWWGVESDPSHWEWHRPYWRTDGFAAGASFGVDHRSTAASWGDGGNGRQSRSSRNEPEEWSGVVSQWAQLGIPFAERFRLEIFEEAGFQTGDDDLTRRAVGGMNPYVVPVSGAPWAAFLASQWVSGGVRQRVGVIDSMELGIVVDGAVVDDIDRTGDSGFGGVMGVALEMDWRPREVWQVDASVGYSPDTGAWASNPHFGAYVGVGRAW